MSICFHVMSMGGRQSLYKWVLYNWASVKNFNEFLKVGYCLTEECTTSGVHWHKNSYPFIYSSIGSPGVFTRKIEGREVRQEKAFLGGTELEKGAVTTLGKHKIPLTTFWPKEKKPKVNIEGHRKKLKSIGRIN